MLDFTLSVPKEIRAALSDSDFLLYVQDGSDDSPAELGVFDTVGDSFWGDGVTASEVSTFLSANRGRQVNVTINSPGGLAYDGLSIYNELSHHDGRVETTITGLAYSAASVIALAADEVKMHEAANYGIHRSAVMAMGNARNLRDMATWLDKLDAAILSVYRGRTGLSDSQLDGFLDGEEDGTIWTAAEAAELGFVDTVIPAKSKEAQTRQKAVARQRIHAENSAKVARLRARFARFA